MKKINLTATADIGELGLKIDGVPTIDYPMVATQGLMIAHDILEHQQGFQKIGTIGDELIALGGTWYCRGEYFDMRRNPRPVKAPHDDIASDVANMGLMVIEENRKIYTKVGNHYAYSNIDIDIDEIIYVANKNIRKVLECCDHNLSNQEVDDKIGIYLNAAKNLIAQGYTMANRRFKGEQYAANRLFWDIAKEADKIISMVERAGQRFKLSYGGGRVIACEI